VPSVAPQARRRARHLPFHRAAAGLGEQFPLNSIYPERVRLLAALVVAALAHGDRAPRPVPLHAVTLWSWERPDDLRWLAGSGVRVAMLDRTLLLRDGQLEVDLRRQPLHLADDTPLITVVRIESDGRPLPSSLASAVADHIVAASRVPRAAGVQIDFDARLSERAFYSVVLRDVRGRLAPHQTLSMTALASWCAEDPWIAEDVVHEIVPMLFEMGPDARAIVRRLQDNRTWAITACNQARGISTDEPWANLPPTQMLYIWRARNEDITTRHALESHVRRAGVQ